MGWLGNIFGPKGEKPTEVEQRLAAELAREIREKVFCGPGEGELELTGDTAKDAVPNFRWMHGKARDVVQGFRGRHPELPERLRDAVEALHRSAARTTEILAPAAAMEDVKDHAELTGHMKKFLEELAVIGSVAQGKRWGAGT